MATWNSKDKPFEKLAKTVEKQNRRLLNVVGVIAKDFFQNDVFEAEGFIDRGLSPWTPSQRALKDGGKTLQDTGRLRRSARMQVTSNKRVEVSFNTPYAVFVNNTRQYIGDSKRLNKKLEKAIIKHIAKILEGK